MKPKCFFRGCDHKMKTSIAKRNFCSHQYLVTDILNAHITKKFEKTYRIINLRRYPPQSANETRKCAGTPMLTNCAAEDSHSHHVWCHLRWAPPK